MNQKYIVSIPGSEWEGVLCGPLSAHRGVEKVKARILEELGLQTEWTVCLNPKGYYVTPASLMELLAAGV